MSVHHTTLMIMPPSALHLFSLVTPTSEPISNDENAEIGKDVGTGKNKSEPESPLRNSMVPSDADKGSKSAEFDESCCRHTEEEHLKVLNDDTDSSVTSAPYVSQHQRNRMKKRRFRSSFLRRSKRHITR